MDLLAIPLALAGAASIGAAWTALYLVLRGPREGRAASRLASPTGIAGAGEGVAPEFVLATAAPAVARAERMADAISTTAPLRPSPSAPPPAPAGSARSGSRDGSGSTGPWSAGR
ncbi:MAG: hypothetical protein R3F20_14990 [Planctomycetota bacterium]